MKKHTLFLFIFAIITTNVVSAAPSQKNLRVMRLKSLREKHDTYQSEIAKLKHESSKKSSFVDEEVEELKEMIFLQEETILDLTEQLRKIQKGL